MPERSRMIYHFHHGAYNGELILFGYYEKSFSMKKKYYFFNNQKDEK